MKATRKNIVLAALVSSALLFSATAMADGDKYRHDKGDFFYKPYKSQQHKPAKTKRVEKHVYHHYGDAHKPGRHAKKYGHYKKRAHDYGRYDHDHHHARRYDYRDRYGYYDDYDGRVRFSISYYDWF